MNDQSPARSLPPPIVYPGGPYWDDKEEMFDAVWSPGFLHELAFPEKSGYAPKRWPFTSTTSAVVAALDAPVNCFFSCAEFAEGAGLDGRVLGARAFWLDLPRTSRTHAGYTDPISVSNDALMFGRKFGLAAYTHLIESSDCFHVMWALDQQVPNREWQATARDLALLCAATDLRTNLASTVDIRHLFPIPQTWSDFVEDEEPDTQLVQRYNARSASRFRRAVRAATQRMVEAPRAVPLCR